MSEEMQVIEQNEEAKSVVEKVDFNNLASLSREEIRSLISEVEAKMKVHPDQIEIPVEERFAKNIYARTIVMPKGSLVVGKIHKYQNLNIMTKGELSMICIDGVKRFKAPCIVVSSPGIKRLSYAHEETEWTTILGTDETDAQKIEEQFIAKNYSEVPEQNENQIINVEVKPCLS